MKKIGFLFVVLLFVFAGCFPSKPNEEEKEEYELSIDSSFQTNYEVGDAKPNWLDAVIFKRGGQEIEKLGILVDDSDVNLKIAGTYEVIFKFDLGNNHFLTKTLKIVVSEPKEEIIMKFLSFECDVQNANRYDLVTFRIILDNPQAYEIVSVKINSFKYSEFKEESSPNKILIDLSMAEGGLLNFELTELQYKVKQEIRYLRINSSITIDVFDPGDGTKENPYKIFTCEEFDQIRNELSAHYILMNDLDFTLYDANEFEADGNWEPLGDENTPFSGSLNGNGYTIRNIKINQPSRDYLGLFGYLSGEVYDLVLGDVSIIGKDYVGAVAGYIKENPALNRLYITGNVWGENNVGGVAGKVEGGIVFDLSSTVNVTGKNNVGGIVGSSIASFYLPPDDIIYTNLEYIFSFGKVSGLTAVGGIVGNFIGALYHGTYFFGRLEAPKEELGFNGTNWNYQDLIIFKRFKLSRYWDLSPLENNCLPKVKIKDSTLTQEDIRLISVEASAQNHLYLDESFNYFIICVELGNTGGLAVDSVIINGEEYSLFEEESTTERIIIKIEHNPVESGIVEYKIEDIFFKSKLPVVIQKPKFQAEVYKKISDLNGLDAIRNHLNGCYELVSDLDLSESDWQPLGEDQSFGGIFNGNGNKISGLYLEDEGVERFGLFFRIGSKGIVKNLVLEDFYLKGLNYIGGLSVYNSGTIENVSVYGEFFGYSNVGSLVGINYGSVNNCFGEVKVSGTYKIGGLIGINSDGLIYSSEANVQVSGKETVGGLTGANFGTIDSSFASGTITGDSRVGGLVGTGGKIRNSSALAEVYGKDFVGGLVGKCSLSVSYSYFLGRVEGSGTGIGGLIGHVVNEYGKVSIFYSYANADIVGGSDTGGIVGRNENGYLKYCYFSGNVAGATNVGGLVGVNLHFKDFLSHIENSYSSGTIQGNENVGGLVGVNAGIIECSFSLANVVGVTNVGGFLGLQTGEEVKNSFASGNVTGEVKVGRFIGHLNSGKTFNIFYYENQIIQGDENSFGIPVTYTELKSEDWYLGIGFSTNVWDYSLVEAGFFPKLINLEQNCIKIPS